MGDVVVGHREDRELRDRSGPALDAACALVDGREVGVPVWKKKEKNVFFFFFSVVSGRKKKLEKT